MKQFITTKEAAKRLGVSERRIRQLLQAGKFRALKVGRDWIIASSSLTEVKVYGKAGRPQTNKKVLGKS